MFQTSELLEISKTVSKIKKKQMILLSLAGIATLIAFIYLLGGPEEALGLILLITPMTLTTMVLLELVNITLYGIAWWLILRAIRGKVNLKECVVAGYVSILGDMLVPTGITGEALWYLYATRRLKVKSGEAAVSIIVHRLIDSLLFTSIVLISWIRLSLLYHWRTHPLGQYVSLVVLASIFCFSCLYILLHVDLVSDHVENILTKISHKLSKYKMFSRIEVLRFFNDFQNAALLIRHNMLSTTLITLVLLTRWLSGISIPYVVFNSLGYKVSFWLTALAYPLYGLTLLLPGGIPAMIGILDVTMISIFLLLGIKKGVAIAVSFITRLVTIVTDLLFISIISAYMGISEFIK